MKSIVPRRLRIGLSLMLLGCVAACGGGGGSPSGPGVPSGAGGHYKVGKPYQINGKWYEPAYDPSYQARGEASWYGAKFHGRQTANGEIFDKNLLSAAHPTLPLPSVVRVTNLRNGRSLELRVNDRGPFAKNRIIDLSEAAATVLGFKHAGTAPVEVEFIRLADSSGKPPTPTQPARRYPEPQQVAAVRAAPRAECGTYYVQAGAFTDRARAERLTTELQRILPGSVRTHTVEQPGLTKVQAGPLADRRAAEAVKARVIGAGHYEAFVMEVRGSGAACGPRPV